ncbi:AraC-type DNA-binding protein [Thermomonospora echinospora]|uniref:AraC-type DNA-binding protein n=1 Tax=Thermomonospora echinospora TaxID=1992 RepID=A0A1H6DHS5_9ACTN|nr:helix-turn-helix transcriptional regulator [Thermomonospora echinospora]SEG84712.1 AraC-type DNA-binding protein [Thermomonospora echinospora]
MTVYIDSAGRAGRALSARVQPERDNVGAWTEAARPALAVVEEATPDLQIAERAVATLTGGAVAGDAAADGAWSGGRGPGGRGDALDRAVTLLPQLTGGPIRLPEVAAAVSLSPSRLRHLFSERLGLPFTAYVRWVRLRATMHTVREGGTLTQAAHAAGFTDSAHLTRVCRAMFGITPTQAARAAGWHPPRHRHPR